MAKKINKKEKINPGFVTILVVVAMIIVAIIVLYNTGVLDDKAEKSQEIADAICVLGLQFKGAEFVNESGDKFIYRCTANNITVAPEGNGTFSVVMD
jgi:hypothetical protein